MGCVFGDFIWFGVVMSYNSGKIFDIVGEINFFLIEVM